MPHAVLLIAYFFATSAILTVAGLAYFTEPTGGLFVGATMVALYRAGRFFFATEWMSTMQSPPSGRRMLLLRAIAAFVDALALMVGVVVIALMSYTATVAGASSLTTGRIAAFAICALGTLLFAAVWVIPALRKPSAG